MSVGVRQSSSRAGCKAGLMAAALVAAATALSGCSNSDMFSAQGAEQWFSKPFTGFSKQDWAIASTGKDPNALRPLTPEDYVDASGRCAAPAPVAAAPADPAATQPAAPAEPGAPTVAGGIALLMSECEVVARAGAPERVELGSNASGDRTAVLSYSGGPWPGIYHFTGGRLSEIDAAPHVDKPKSAPRKRAPAKPKTATR